MHKNQIPIRWKHWPESAELWSRSIPGSVLGSRLWCRHSWYLQVWPDDSKHMVHILHTEVLKHCSWACKFHFSGVLIRFKTRLQLYFVCFDSHACHFTSTTRWHNSHYIVSGSTVTVIMWVWADRENKCLLLIKCYKPARTVLLTTYQSEIVLHLMTCVRLRKCVWRVLPVSRNNRTTHLWSSVTPLSQASRHIWLQPSKAVFLITSWLLWGRGGQSQLFETPLMASVVCAP